MGFRVALLGIYHESNTFITNAATQIDFQNSHWLWGDDIIVEYRDAHHEIGGMLEVMDREGVELVPIMFAEATPGGIVTDETYSELLTGMLDVLRCAMPIDGCLVVPHGAAVSESEHDMDGHWLEAVRDVLGPEIPIVGTLDLHANVSPRMVRATDTLVAYKTNPHLDQRKRGKEAGNLLIKQLRGEIKPVQRLMQLPLVVGIEQQCTDESPAKDIYAYAMDSEQEAGVLSVSVTLGFPYADVEDMGTSVIVVADGNVATAVDICRRLSDRLCTMRDDFVGEKISVSQAIGMLPHLQKPVLLLDMGDNIGGGTQGKGLALIKALEKKGTYRYFSYQPDRDVIERLKEMAIGKRTDLRFLGSEELEDEPWEVPVILADRLDGKFTENQPQHGGQARFDMGDTLILTTPGGGTLMVSEWRIPPFSSKQMTTFGLDPSAFDVVVAKGVNAPIAAYGPYCPSVLKVDTPGASRSDLTKLVYHYRRKPMFPFEDA